MKKLFIICLALIISLTSCDLSFLSGKDKTPEPELPMIETVTLAELINKEEVAYIKHKETFYADANDLTYIVSYDVDQLFAILIDKNAEKEFLTDIEDVYDLFDSNLEAANIADRRPHVKYVAWTFYNEENIMLGTLVLCSNNTLIYTDFVSFNYYISVEYSNVDVNELIDTLYQSDYLDK